VSHALLLLLGPLLGAAPSPQWWERGVCYEVFVRSFYDSDGDGIGDLRGLTEKLPYISDLGASCIWLMPIAQSPSYHGYDVTNYYEINRDYGTTEDFKRLIAEAHKRGISVLVDLVLNHASSEHPWFQSALFVPGSPYRNWFLWSPTARRVPGWQAEVWHRSPTSNEYYYGLFWGGMPDLNLGNPAVQAETKRIARYWLEEMGVDGFRLDAVAHFFESGDTVRDAPATHPWLRDYTAYIHQIAPNAFTVGEVSGSTALLRPYYPDQLDTYFEFEVADAILDAVRSGSSRGLASALQQAQRDLPPGRWASFLRNHDQTRTMTELRGDVPRAKLAATLLLTLPGVPFIYYGEEIGMTGDKPDPRLRTPMHWARMPAAGFTRGQEWEPLQPDSFTANVAAQDGDSTSLLNLYRRLVHLRAARPELGSAADLTILSGGSDTVFAYLRRAEGRAVLVLANLSGRHVSGPRLSSTEAVLAPGRYRGLRVARDGRIRGWIAVPSLAPFESRVIELVRVD
jgi:glycosidase